MDELTAPDDPQKVLRIIAGYYADSRDSVKRQERIERSAANNAAFGGRFDFSNKIEGQSRESLPKVTTAVESFAAFIRRGLTQFGAWFRVEISRDEVLSAEDIANLLKEYLREMPDGLGGVKSIEQVISDGAKAGALDSLVALKVHGARRKRARPAEIKAKPPAEWRLSIDVMPIEDYYPDPTGRKLYEIHEKRVDLFQVVQMAEAGAYDKAQVDAIAARAPGGSGTHASDKARLDRDESAPRAPGRSTVSVREFYGTLVDSDGTLISENVQATVADEHYLIQAPKPIKAWCGAPFAVGPLTRVPHSVWHRAIIDFVADLNQSLNELYNLIFDAGISAVHGVKEVRLGWLEDPASIAGGIAPQQTIAINETAPANASAVSVAKTGQIPGEVLALFQAVQRELLEAAMTNEMKVGSLPQKQVLATEIISSDQQTAVLLDAVLGEYEQVLSLALTKAWQLMLQNADYLDAGTVIRALGPEKAQAFARMDAEERWRRYMRDAQVVVTGLSSISQKAIELRKLIALLATVRADPLLAQEYEKTVSAAKLFERVFAMAGVDLRDIQRSAEEIEAMGAAAEAPAPAPREGPVPLEEGPPPPNSEAGPGMLPAGGAPDAGPAPDMAQLLQ